MLERIVALEAEVRELKAAKVEQPVSANPETKPLQPQDPSSATITDAAPSDPQIAEIRRGLQFRGFGDVDLRAGDSGQSNGFQLGIFNLLMDLKGLG